MENSALINTTQRRLMNIYIDWFLHNALQFFPKVKFFIPTSTIDMIWWMEERKKEN